MANIHLYKGNPTAGGTDGQLVSEGTGANPVSVGPLNIVAEEESASIKLALRCETGYATSGNTTVSLVGINANMWALAPDNAGSPDTFGAYGALLTISDVIGATNHIIWVKAKTVNTESPSNDTGVKIQIDCNITST